MKARNNSCISRSTRCTCSRLVLLCSQGPVLFSDINIVYVLHFLGGCQPQIHCPIIDDWTVNLTFKVILQKRIKYLTFKVILQKRSNLLCKLRGVLAVYYFCCLVVACTVGKNSSLSIHWLHVAHLCCIQLRIFAGTLPQD